MHQKSLHVLYNELAKESSKLHLLKGGKMYKKVFKRLFDIILSFLGIVILALPMIIVAVLIKIDSPGPVLFKQKRIAKGRGGVNNFYIYKFRTMRTDTPHDAPTHLLKGANAYITRIGAFLRKTSLDELPQLFNIFCGKMSIIGPRPALWNQFDLIVERDKYNANEVKPGLTGWAQINGRDELEISVKARLDGEYVDKLSFAFDCKCFFGTFKSVLKREGVVEGTQNENVEKMDTDEKVGNENV